MYLKNLFLVILLLVIKINCTNYSLDKTVKEFTEALQYLINNNKMNVAEKQMIGSALYKLILIKLKENEMLQMKRIQEQMEEKRRLENQNELKRQREAFIFNFFLANRTSGSSFHNDFHTMRY